MQEKPESFDELFNSFDFTQRKDVDEPRRKGITIWVDPEYHGRYEAVQQRRNKKFSRLLKALIQMAIDFEYKKSA
jgi:hypothetical protein